MQDYWGFIGNFYCKRGIFVCGRRGSRSEDEIEVEVCHLFDPPATKEQIKLVEEVAGRTLPPSYRRFLEETNGALIFTQESKSGEYDCGCLIYPVELVSENQDDAKAWPRDCLDDDDIAEEEKKQYQQWIDTLLVIGEEVASGNYIAIDFSRKGCEPEYPIIFLDHELPLAASDLTYEAPVLGTRIDDFLYNAAQNPAGFLMEKLGATVCYLDEANPGQWYPKKYRVRE